jgi:hypothetical protein
VSPEFGHGSEPRAEEAALHQKYITLLNQMKTALADGDEPEARRLEPLLDRAKRRWLHMNRRVTRDL